MPEISNVLQSNSQMTSAPPKQEPRPSPIEMVRKMSGILEEEENEDDSLKSSSVQSNRKKSMVDHSASGTSYMNIDLT